jgi:hypothetical protein
LADFNFAHRRPLRSGFLADLQRIHSGLPRQLWTLRSSPLGKMPCPQRNGRGLIGFV